MVNILIAGELSDLKRMRQALMERQPLMVMKGTGYAAEGTDLPKLKSKLKSKKV